MIMAKIKIWNHKTGVTFGTTVNRANIIFFLLVLFLILTMESGAIRRKGLKSRLLAANPAYHIAAHHAAFSASAFCRLQLILRRCGCGGGGVAGVAPKL